MDLEIVVMAAQPCDYTKKTPLNCALFKRVIFAVYELHFNLKNQMEDLNL